MVIVTEKQARGGWVVADDQDARLELFLDVADAMRSGARRGIRRVLRAHPSEHDVEDVAVLAFNEFWEMDRSGIQSLGGMAHRIAYRRGFDLGRRVIRERGAEERTGLDLIPAPDDDSDSRELRHAAIMAIVQRCKEQLTAEQREVIGATVEGTLEGTMLMKDFAALRGTTYQACSRMRDRGIAALGKCVQAVNTTGAQ